ncbi:MAG: alpha/beta hydrolase fold domain-containing protein, partial [Dehalococcoidia bacterium]|nr:alpha/beta hydrolase fold domain-containing protein [Dehalococcoidia bacterium]
AVALHARDAGGPAIAHQLLAYPVTDSRMDSASYSELATGFGLGRDAMRWFWDCYVPEGGAVSREDVRVSPAHAKDLSGLPSAQVITAEYDPLRDEGEAYAARLRGSGVEVRAERVAGQLHGFFSRPYVFDAGEQAVTDASEELKRVFALIAAGSAGSAGSDGSAEAPKVAESGDTPKEAGESGGGVLSLGWWARRLGIGNRRTRP